MQYLGKSCSGNVNDHIGAVGTDIGTVFTDLVASETVTAFGLQNALPGHENARIRVFICFFDKFTCFADDLVLVRFDAAPGDDIINRNCGITNCLNDRCGTLSPVTCDIDGIDA